MPIRKNLNTDFINDLFVVKNFKLLVAFCIYLNLNIYFCRTLGILDVGIHPCTSLRWGNFWVGEGVAEIDCIDFLHL